MIIQRQKKQRGRKWAEDSQEEGGWQNGKKRQRGKD